MDKYKIVIKAIKVEDESEIEEMTGESIESIKSFKKEMIKFFSNDSQDWDRFIGLIIVREIN